jgi:hypothetical protein
MDLDGRYLAPMEVWRQARRAMTRRQVAPLGIVAQGIVGEEFQHLPGTMLPRRPVGEASCPVVPGQQVESIGRYVSGKTFVRVPERDPLRRGQGRPLLDPRPQVPPERGEDPVRLVLLVQKVARLAPQGRVEGLHGDAIGLERPPDRDIPLAEMRLIEAIEVHRMYVERHHMVV